MKAKSTKPIQVMQRNAAAAEAMLKQLANAKRLMVLCHLVGGEKSVGELSKTLELSNSSLSQHLAKMREASLVSADKRGKMVYYRIANVEVQALLSTLYLLYCKS